MRELEDLEKWQIEVPDTGSQKLWLEEKRVGRVDLES